MTLNLPNDINLNSGPNSNLTLTDLTFCKNEKPDLDLAESKINLPAGEVSWYQNLLDIVPLNKSTLITDPSSTFYLSIKDKTTNCVSLTRPTLTVKVNNGQDVQLNPLFGLCSNETYTIKDLDKSVTNDLVNGTINWYNDNSLPIVGLPLSKNVKVDFSKSYYAIYVPNNTQECSSNNKKILLLNLVNSNSNIVLSELSQKFCYEPVKFVSDIKTSPYTNSQVQLFSSISDLNSKLTGNEQLQTNEYYLRSKTQLSNTTCFSDNVVKISIDIYKPIIDLVTHYENCGKKNGYLELINYPQNASITWYKDNVVVNNNSPVLKNLDRGSFEVKVIDEGCENSKKIELSDCSPIEIPEILTPNNDLKNDTWQTGLYVKYPGVSVKIYNRWGNQIYESPIPYKDDWDGKTQDGEYIQTGTYYYIIDKGNDEPKISGFIEFIK